jgi:hypothetical protein
MAPRLGSSREALLLPSDARERTAATWVASWLFERKKNGKKALEEVPLRGARLRRRGFAFRSKTVLGNVTLRRDSRRSEHQARDVDRYWTAAVAFNAGSNSLSWSAPSERRQVPQCLTIVAQETPV